MKKILILFSCLMLLTKVYSQQHQIEVGAGVLSSNATVDILSNIGKNLAGSAFTGSTLTNSQYYGEFRASYSYLPLNWLATGATASFSRSMHDHIQYGEYTGKQEIDYFTIAAEATFYYMNREHVRLYGLIGVGGTFVQQTDRDANSSYLEVRNYNYLNFQLSPIGIEAGAQQFGGFMELGFGYRGIISLGAYFRL